MIQADRESDDDLTLTMLSGEAPELGPALVLTVEYVPDAGRVIVEAAPGAGCTVELVVRTPD